MNTQGKYQKIKIIDDKKEKGLKRLKTGQKQGKKQV